MLLSVGLLAVAMILTSDAFERRSRWFFFGFAGACAVAAIFDFL